MKGGHTFGADGKGTLPGEKWQVLKVIQLWQKAQDRTSIWREQDQAPWMP